MLSLYNLIQENQEEKIKLYLDAVAANKGKREAQIKQKIKNLITKGGSLTNIIKKARYHIDKYAVRNLLIANNIAITNTLTPVSRFNFSFFGERSNAWTQGTEGTYQWDVEHIYSTNESFLENASIEEQVVFLEKFCSDDNDTFKSYIETLYAEGCLTELIEQSQNKDETEFTNELFEKISEKYTQEYDQWRYFKLRNKAKDLINKFKILSELEKVLKVENSSEIRNATIANFDTEKAELFIHNSDYYDREVFLCQ